MKNGKYVKTIFFGLLCLLSLGLYAQPNETPVGFWKTIDDVTGQPKAIVQIWETPNKKLFGRVLKVFPRPGHTQNELCVACTGDRKNKHIVGMVILENLQKMQDERNKWGYGEILDPKNGKTYHCNLQLADRGKKLKARGYIGLPLFGRTQTWQRVADPQAVA